MLAISAPTRQRDCYQRLKTHLTTTTLSEVRTLGGLAPKIGGRIILLGLNALLGCQRAVEELSPRVTWTALGHDQLSSAQLFGLAQTFVNVVPWAESSG